MSPPSAAKVPTNRRWKQESTQGNQPRAIKHRVNVSIVGTPSVEVKLVMPADAGIQVGISRKFKNALDSGFRRNDRKYGQFK
jgi:hypothetical protein